jgi:predicted DNA-binding antitoxin AbrB/MazE fold protein
MAFFMKVKAAHECQVLRPLEKLDLKVGDKVQIVVKKNIADKTFGLIQIDPDVIDEIIEDTKYGSV